MTKAGDNDRKPNKKGGRSDRLAAALRQNLRRRKAQERQRGAVAASGPRTSQKGPEEPKS
jgi:hypothetical protein